MHLEPTKIADGNADENIQFGKKWRVIEG